MVLPGLINLDFADVRTVMTEMGKAMMGTGEASGEGRALMAAENAIQNPLLDEVSLKGARAVLVNITGGLDMTLLEVDEAANAISGQVDPEANIIFGAAFDPALEGVVRVSVVATGMDGAAMAAITPKYEPEPVYAPAPVVELQPANVPTPEPVPVMAVSAPAQPVTAQGGFAFDNVAPLQPAVSAPAIADEQPFAMPPRYGDDRRQKSGGWLSLFGGRRAEGGHAAPPRTMAQAQPAQEVYEDEDAAEDEDLEIPSFLRRLAN
jgi:cell division protein FtsZ